MRTWILGTSLLLGSLFLFSCSQGKDSKESKLSIFCLGPDGKPFFRVEHAEGIWIDRNSFEVLVDGKRFYVSGTCVVGELNFQEN